MTSHDANPSDAPGSDPIERKSAIGERLKRLQEKTGDLSETLERIDKRLEEVVEGDRDA
jgi:hypothetical protein